jgi:signal peptidase I
MKKKNIKKEILSWLTSVVLIVVLALAVDNFLIVNAIVPTGSMETTIMPGERLIGSRLTYDFCEPKRGDIVIFRFPDDEKQVFIKRIIGLPGEKVYIVTGKVYIDNASAPLDEPYLNVIPTGSYGPFQVPSDSFFVMGDNRNESFDSRFWENHFVKKDNFLGKAAFGYFPKIYGLK